MKTRLPWILVVLLAVALAAVSFSRRLVTHAAAKSAERPILYWVDPMHPSYRSDRPGKAPDCGMDLVPVRQGDAAPAAAGGVAIDTRRQQLIGVQIGTVESRPMGRSVRTTATIAGDETRVARVTTKFDGYIDHLYADFTGQPVRRGQPLFTIYSPDLLATQQEYLLALRAGSQVPGLIEATRQRLRLWDITDADLRQLEKSGVTKRTLTIASPVSGVITSKMAVAGARVMAGEPLFEIADLGHVWALADVYESELSLVRVGSPASVTVASLPGRTFAARVSFISPTVDPMTRTVKVRLDLPNADGALKPEMFAEVTLSEPAREALSVPDSAVLQTGTRSVVFVVREDGSFAPREVEAGLRAGGRFEIRSGLSAGEKVATQANFLIDSESRLRSAMEQMK